MDTHTHTHTHMLSIVQNCDKCPVRVLFATPRFSLFIRRVHKQYAIREILMFTKVCNCLSALNDPIWKMDCFHPHLSFFSLQRVCRLSAPLPTDSNSWSPADGTSAERQPGLALNRAKDHSLHEAQDRSMFLGGVHSLNGRLTRRQKSVMAFNCKSITGFVSYRTCQSAFSRKSHRAKDAACLSRHK